MVTNCKMIGAENFDFHPPSFFYVVIFFTKINGLILCLNARQFKEQLCILTIHTGQN